MPGKFDVPDPRWTVIDQHACSDCGDIFIAAYLRDGCCEKCWKEALSMDGVEMMTPKELQPDIGGEG